MLLLGALAAAGFGLRHAGMLDRHFVFFPDSELVGDPADVGLDFEDVFFSTADGVGLHGWLVPGETDKTLIWFHGNAGNISHRLSNLAMLHHRLGASVFIFDYRGYGRSEGKVTERGTYLDAEAALEYLRSQKDVSVEQDLVLFGRSLGGAVAVEMAVRHPVYAVILESPFTSIRGMAKRTYPWLPSAVVAGMLRSKYDSLATVGGVHSPLMVLHGDLDEIVPIDEGRELFDAANEPKRFYTIAGAGHNDTYTVGGEAYFEALRRFIEDPAGGINQ